MDRLTLAQIAEHLDMSERALRDHLGVMGIDHRTSSLDDIRIAYIRRLREIAAGRGAGDDGIDLARERALLARSSREKNDLANAVTRRELAPVGVLSAILAKVSKRVAVILEKIPVDIKQKCPDIPPDALEIVRQSVIQSRNIASNVKFSFDALDKLGDDEEEDKLE